MIVYDLSCDGGHRFEGWFGSSEDFERQQARGLVSCPHCGGANVRKAPMAPAVPRKGNQQLVPASAPGAAKGGDAAARPMKNGAIPPEVRAALERLAEAQRQALRDSTWVGRDFAETSRAMHYGEREQAPIHGEASMAEAKALFEEGIPVAPLPFPVARPEELN